MAQKYPPKPSFTKSEIKRAGKILGDETATAEKQAWARNVLAEWRGCHGYPINTFQATLRTKLARGFGAEPIVGQRLKRASTIIQKLKDFPAMDLFRMQDIGGVRAALATLPEMRRIEAEYRDRTRFSHELLENLSKDYIQNPKADGYRSVHLVYRYKNPNPRYRQHDDLLIELQLRTKLQHSWAIASEIATMVLGKAIKSRGSQGQNPWRDFFALTSSAFACLEKSPVLPAHEKMTPPEIFLAVEKAAKELDVETMLRGVIAAGDHITRQSKRGYYNLIILDTEKRTVRVIPFAQKQLQEATEAYARAEASGDHIEPVLVRATNIRKAYPSFFLDAKMFLDNLQKVTEKV